MQTPTKRLLEGCVTLQLSPFRAQARITDIAKLEGKLDSENAARKSEIAALDSWAKGENDARKTEIENLGRTKFNSVQF